jgi:hypothetical protein
MITHQSQLGTVYLGVHILSQKEVAIKVEPLHIKQSQLEHEFQVYKTFTGSVGIPTVQWFGMECDHNVMVLELLGLSLEDLLGRCNQKFSLKTVLLLADQMVRTNYPATLD